MRPKPKPQPPSPARCPYAGCNRKKRRAVKCWCDPTTCPSRTSAEADDLIGKLADYEDAEEQRVEPEKIVELSAS
jgi:hypothetical protein